MNNKISKRYYKICLFCQFTKQNDYVILNSQLREVIKLRQKIRLDTMTDIQKFVEIVSRVDEQVYLEDGTGYKVSAKSLLFAAIAKMEWESVYCCCDKDIAVSILPWII